MLIGFFWKCELVENINKSKAMTCHLEEIWSGMSEEAVGRGQLISVYWLEIGTNLIINKLKARKSALGFLDLK